jgi:prepilin-type N-terminal cleavage/methylation domain-containing protein
MTTPQKSSKTPSLHPSGFTLVELLIVITIIAVLAALIFVGAQRGIAAANRSKTVSQMREIGLAVAAWAAEVNNNEPMYFRDGSGDSSSESTPALGIEGRSVCAGNPAILLYNRASPQNSYLQKPSSFFAATQKWNVPLDRDYDPSTTSTTRLWGTFMWVYPSVPADDRTERQKTIMRSSNFTAVSQYAYNNLLMFNDYSNAKQKDVKDRSYFALFRDSSVRNVASHSDIWGWFFRGR